MTLLILVVKKNGHQGTSPQIYGVGWSTDPDQRFPRGPFRSGGVMALADHKPKPPTFEVIPGRNTGHDRPGNGLDRSGNRPDPSFVEKPCAAAVVGIQYEQTGQIFFF